MPQRAGLVLAGGVGRRIGRPKGSIELDGRPLAVRAAGLLEPLCDRVYISVAPGAASPAEGYPVVADSPPAGRGPLAGIQAGFAVTRADELLVLACDYPRVTGRLLRGLVRADPDADVVLVVGSDGRRHPLAAVWRSGARHGLDDALREGRLAVHRLLERLRVCEMGPSEFPDEDLERCLLNVNEPSDLKRLSDEG